MKASDLFDNEDALSMVITLARQMARGEWEKQFTLDMDDKFQLYGLGMFMSEKQADILRRIAGNPREQSQRSSRPPPPEPPSGGKSLAVIDKAFLRQLTQLCHPDKHDQSPLSVGVTQRLNKLRALI